MQIKSRNIRKLARGLKHSEPVGVGNLSTLSLTVSEAVKINVYPNVYIPQASLRGKLSPQRLKRALR